MKRCGERSSIYDSFMKSFGVFHVGNFLRNHSICELLGDKMKRPLHLCDTWGLRILSTGSRAGVAGPEYPVPGLSAYSRPATVTGPE